MPCIASAARRLAVEYGNRLLRRCSVDRRSSFITPLHSAARAMELADQSIRELSTTPSTWPRGVFDCELWTADGRFQRAARERPRVRAYSPNSACSLRRRGTRQDPTHEKPGITQRTPLPPTHPGRRRGPVARPTTRPRPSAPTHGPALHQPRTRLEIPRLLRRRRARSLRRRDRRTRPAHRSLSPSEAPTEHSTSSSSGAARPAAGTATRSTPSGPPPPSPATSSNRSTPSTTIA